MKKIIKRVGVGLLIATLLVGCGMSTEQIGEAVKTSMQQKFDSDSQFKKWNLSVTMVQVLKQSENRFQGIATVVHEGTSHEVPVEITADDSNIIWQVQPGAFMFIGQKELQKLQDVLK
jgi:VCBS repeat-containing protein